MTSTPRTPINVPPVDHAVATQSLIAASSVGAALADVEARGIDAHLADIEATDATPPKKKRKKPAPLTAKTLAVLRTRGWTAQVVERWMPHTHIKVDLFGVIDIVAIRPASESKCAPRCGLPTIVGIQVTGSRMSGGIIAAHRTKILAEPRAAEWVAAGGAIELWGWRMVRNRWKLTIETYADMRENVGYAVTKIGPDGR